MRVWLYPCSAELPTTIVSFTTIGGEEFSYKFKYETSLVGSELGSHYDELRGYNDYNLGFGGTLPIIKNIRYWVSGQYTSKDNYRVYGFDSLAYVDGTGDCSTPYNSPVGSPHVRGGDLLWQGSVPANNEDNACNK
mgnify:CR=1 FL=1